MKITDLRVHTVAVPIEATIRHSNGAHHGRFIRTIVELETDSGLVGLGEMGGGGASAQASLEALRPYVIGHDPFRFETLWAKLNNPTASLYNDRRQQHAALEFACLDLVGKHLGISVSELLGGRLRDDVPFASYLFYRYADAATGASEVRTVDSVVAHAAELKKAHGFASHKLKGGVFPPQHELDCYLALAEAFPEDQLRYDPNAVLTVRESIEFGRAIQHLTTNDYFEDPTWGLNGMRQVGAEVPLRMATNTVVVGFEQLATNVRDPACDVILLDTTFWGGVRRCIKAAAVCETMQTEIAVHSSGELGIQLATMLHLGAVLPNLTFSADAHYHHLVDDVIVGGKMEYVDGAIAVPTGPGLGVELDHDRLAEWKSLYDEIGGYAYDQDPGRPGWVPMVPQTSFADPARETAPRSMRDS